MRTTSPYFGGRWLTYGCRGINPVNSPSGPISRTAALVGYGDNEDHLGVNPVHEIEGETVQGNATSLTMHWLVDSGMFEQKPQGDG